MTREEAVAQLEGLQAEHEGSRLYLPIGAAPELMLPDGGGSRVYIAWEGTRWAVSMAWCSPRGLVTRGDTVERDTLAECVEWLAGRE